MEDASPQHKVRKCDALMQRVVSVLHNKTSPLPATLDQRDEESRWSVLHYLAHLGCTKTLAAVLTKPQCPIDTTDDRGRTPLLLALRAKNRIGALLLLKAMDLRTLPWKEVWEKRAR